MGKRSFQEAHGCPVAARAASRGCAGSQPGPGERAGPTDRLRLSAPTARPRDRRPEAARGQSGCGPSAATGAGVPGAGRASGAGSSRGAAGEGHEPSGSLSPHCSRLRSRTGPASSRWAGLGARGARGLARHPKVAARSRLPLPPPAHLAPADSPSPGSQVAGVRSDRGSRAVCIKNFYFKYIFCREKIRCLRFLLEKCQL